MLKSRMTSVVAVVVFAGGISVSSDVSAQLKTGWRAHDLKRPAPAVVDPGEARPSAPAPSDAVVLFGGEDLSQWRSGDGSESKWKVVDGAMESVAGAGYAYTKEEFGDCQLHVEWASPSTVKGNGQGRGNSGVFLMGMFEVQVLDSVDNPTYSDGSAGSIYGQYPPLVNASRGPGQWQTYDIIFQTPKFDESGKLTSPARITVLHNGVLINHGSEPVGPTAWIVHDDYVPGKMTGPIGLQDHGNPVRFRNIWIRNLTPRALPEQPYPNEVELDVETAKKLVGKFEGNRVELRDEKLYFHFGGRPGLEMVPQEDGKFGFRKSAGEVAFKLNDDGVAESIEFTLDAVGTRTAKRRE